MENIITAKEANEIYRLNAYQPLDQIFAGIRKMSDFGKNFYAAKISPEDIKKLESLGYKTRLSYYKEETIIEW